MPRELLSFSLSFTSTGKRTSINSSFLLRLIQGNMFAFFFIFTQPTPQPRQPSKYLAQHPKLNFPINAICNGIVKWSEAGMICHCSQVGERKRDFHFFLKLLRCIYIFFFFTLPFFVKEEAAQKFTTTWTMRKMLSSCSLSISFSRLS